MEPIQYLIQLHLLVAVKVQRVQTLVMVVQVAAVTMTLARTGY
jgi:hypothetical protein